MTPTLGAADDSSNSMAPEISINSVVPGDTFVINITIDLNSTEVYGLQFNLTFDPEVFEAKKPVKGSFFTQDGNSSMEVGLSVDNEKGVVSYGETRYDTDSGISGTGIVATVEFKVKDPVTLYGEKEFHFENVIFSDSFIQPINNIGLKTSSITVMGPPTADFSANRTEGPAPLTVQFTDTSTGTPTSWTWDFGDGSPEEHSQNPLKIYENVGTYNVTLNAINGLGNDRVNKSAYITVHQPIFINETDPTGDVVTSYGKSRVFSINTNYGDDCDISWYLDGSNVLESSLAYTTGTDVAAGSHTVSVKVSSEKYGTAQQTWNWFVYTPISIFNFLPSQDPVSAEGKSPLFKIEANQKCNISWYLNETLVDSTPDVNSDTYQNNSLPVGTYNVTAVAENNYNSSQVIWNWKVLEALNTKYLIPPFDCNSLVNNSVKFIIGLNQECNISWYIDDVLKFTESETNHSIFTDTLNASGDFKVKAVANNSVEELTRTWTWRVYDYVSFDSRSPESDPSTLKGISPDFTVNMNQYCNINWYINGELVDTVYDVSDTYSNTTLLPGNYNLTAVADNLCDSKKTSWNWTVLEYVSISSFPDSDPATLEGISPNFFVSTNQNCTINWYIDGELVDTEDNAVSDTYSNTTLLPGNYNLTAAADNGCDSKQVVWNWTVLPHLAVIDFNPPKEHQYSVLNKTQAFSIELNQEGNVSWFINDTEVRSENNVNSSTYKNESSRLGNHTVKAVIKTEFEEINHTWTWTVVDAFAIMTKNPEKDPVSVAGKTRMFRIDTNQPCNVSWKVNDVVDSSEKLVDFSIFNVNRSIAGLYTVEARAENKFGNDSCNWTWTVVEALEIKSPSPETNPATANGSVQNFSIDANRPCNISWFLDETEVAGAANSKEYKPIGTVGPHNVTVFVTNATTEEKCSHQWDWTVFEPVSIVARSEADPVSIEGKSPLFEIKANQNCTVKWYLNEALVYTTGTSVISDTYQNDSLPAGNYNVTAVADNGYDSNQTVWNWTVLPHLAVIDFNPPKEHQYSVLNKTQAFSIELNQEGNVSWFINDTEVRSENNVNSSTYNNKSSRLGNHTVKAVIKTEFEEKNQTWTWTVVDAFAIMTKNPEKDPVSVAGKTQMFRIDTNQPCNVSWKVNDVVDSSEKLVDFSIFNVNRSTAEIYTVEARAENKFGNDSCNWTWTVVEALEIKSPSPETNPATANGSVQTFSIDANRPCNISWFLDETEVAGAANSKEYKPIGTVGPHNVTVFVTNATTEEKRSHQWDWTVFEPVSIVARSEADPVSIEGKSPEFRIEANQNCTINWFLNEALVDTGTNVIIDTYQNNSLPAGNYNVTAVADNNYDSKQVVWNWTVIETLKISEYFPTADPISIHGEARQFNVTTNRPSNISWYIDDVKVKGPINDIKEDNYTNSTALPWNHNVEVVVENGTEKVNHTWVWWVNPEPVQANFSVNVSKGVAPLTVNFTDMSENATFWFWDFGDTITSFEQSPTHTFNKSGYYPVNLTASNGWLGNLSTLWIVVTEKIESSLSVGENTTIENKSIKFKVEGNISVTDGNKTIHIKNDGMNLSIHSDEGFQNNSGNWSGNYSHAELDKEPENFTLGGELGDIEVSFNASLKNNLLNLNNASITTTVVPGVPENINETDFQLVARNFAEGKVDILYSMSIEKKDLEGTEVKNAWIVMSLPANYVNKSANGPEDFKIMSRSDDGKVTALHTTWILDTKRSVYIFTALSPEGFSVKALVHYTKKEKDEVVKKTSGGGSGTGSCTIISKTDAPSGSEVIADGSDTTSGDGNVAGSNEESSTSQEIKPIEKSEDTEKNTPVSENDKETKKPIPGFGFVFAVSGLVSMLCLLKKSKKE